MALVKATLTPISEDKSKEGARVEVQFNPQQLQVSYSASGPDSRAVASAQSQAPSGAGTGPSGQRTGYASTLSTQLFFDTTATGDDVRQSTLEIIKMFQQPDRTEAPLVRFQWGTFLFYGRINSLSETLDYFSDQGVPLRATMSLTLASNEVDKLNPQAAAGAGTGASAGAGFGLGVSAGISAGAGLSVGASVGFSAAAGVSAGAGVGTTPLTLAQSGDTLQGLSASAGLDWKAVASANDVENPRLLQPGAVLNLKAGS